MARTAGLIGITGATGRLGSRVARRLATAGVGQRLLVRDPSRHPAAEPSRRSGDADQARRRHRRSLVLGDSLIPRYSLIAAEGASVHCSTNHLLAEQLCP